MQQNAEEINESLKELRKIGAVDLARIANYKLITKICLVLLILGILKDLYFLPRYLTLEERNKNLLKAMELQLDWNRGIRKRVESLESITSKTKSSKK